MYCSIQNSITQQRIFTLKSYWAGPQFRAKSQTWPIVTWTIFLTLTKNLIFKDLYFLTRTGCTIINQKFVDSMFVPGAVAKLKSEIFHFFWSQTWRWNGPVLIPYYTPPWHFKRIFQWIQENYFIYFILLQALNFNCFVAQQSSSIIEQSCKKLGNWVISIWFYKFLHMIITWFILAAKAHIFDH